MRKYYQGRYQIQNPQKYKGNPSNCIYRSSWELRLMGFLDRHQSIMEWSSEEKTIPYFSPIDNRTHRYFVDFWVKTKTNEQFLVEVKPKAQTKPPKAPKKQTKKYINEAQTYLTNQLKWQAAEKFCFEKTMKFVILTEDHVGGIMSDKKLESNVEKIFGI